MKSRVKLRPITIEDHENIFRGLSHPDIIKYYGISFETLDATMEQMIWFRDLEEKGTGKWWAICDAETSEFLGAGGFNNLSKENNTAEIGFWLYPEFWGKGYMKEGMELICNYGFTKMGLDRIEGFVETENKNCQRGLEKLQFKLEKTEIDCELKNGKPISIHTYVNLKGSASFTGKE